MFELGWLFWILVAALFFGCGRACGWGGPRERHRIDRKREDGLEGREEKPRLDQARAPEPRRARDPKPVPVAARQSPLKSLQREFVEGRITLEEYERELDALERLD